MLIMVHAMWGMAIAAYTRNIIFLLFGGIGGHILLDAIPHQDLTTVRQVLVDITLGAMVYVILSRIYSLPLYFAWAVLFSTLPDIDVALYSYGVWKRSYFPSHFPSMHGQPASPYGKLMNIAVGVILFMVFLMRMKKGN